MPGFDVAARASAVILLLAGALVGCAAPALPPASIGLAPQLLAEEGLLILDIDTDVPVKQISWNRGVAVQSLPKGQHLWIIRAREGSYRWMRIEFSSQAGRANVYNIELDEEFQFDVVAGHLNYPGELIIRSDAIGRSASRGISVRNRNHSAMAIRSLRDTHAEVIEAYPLRYAGRSGDGFLGHYTAERSRIVAPVVRGPAPAAVVSSPPVGQSADRLFPMKGIWNVLVNPTGKWALAHANKGGVHGLLLQKLGSNEVTPVFAVNQAIGAVQWIGEDTFFAHFQVRGRNRVLVGSIKDDDGEVSIDERWITAPGWFVDPLPLVDDEVIWEFEHKDQNTVHRVSVEELLRYDDLHREGRSGIRLGEKLATIRGSSSRWIVDHSGIPRAALRTDEDGHTILVRSKQAKSFREVYSWLNEDEEKVAWPLSLSADGNGLLVAAYNGNDTKGIFEFDPEGGAFGQTIFLREDVDVTGLVRDHINGDLIAAVYEDGGERRFHYFDTYASRQLGNLSGDFSKEEAYIVSGSADRQTLVLWVSGPTNPGSYYLRNANTGWMAKIAEEAPGLDRDSLTDIETVEVESSDGSRVEAYLAVPQSGDGGGVPLVVYPHGGPIGVRDTKHYDPFVQYLASWGFATLQVNYRGSSGYGRRFEESGKKEWAQGIEDDIDAAVEFAMARPEIDENRVCIIGGSYGGFSALASIVRHPTRYRCAASLNGVTDIPLMFETSDFADSERVLKKFAEVVGDVETNREKLLDLSPVYHVADMQVPVFVVYGTRDRRVDPDHAHRLLLMLETHGKDHQSLEVRRAAHSFTRKEWVIVSRALRRFLTKHLFSSEAFVPDPDLEFDDSANSSARPLIER